MRADNFRAELPAGYAEAYHINAGSGWQAAAFTAASVAMAALIIAPVLAFTDILKRAYAAGAAALLCMVLVGVICIVAYLILHELVHGAAYKLLTGSKLTFGITLTVAFCGVPDIYVTRRTALISLLAPFTLFGALFAGLTAWLPSSFSGCTSADASAICTLPRCLSSDCATAVCSCAIPARNSSFTFPRMARGNK